MKIGLLLALLAMLLVTLALVGSKPLWREEDDPPRGKDGRKRKP